MASPGEALTTEGGPRPPPSGSRGGSRFTAVATLASLSVGLGLAVLWAWGWLPLHVIGLQLTPTVGVYSFGGEIILEWINPADTRRQNGPGLKVATRRSFGVCWYATWSDVADAKRLGYSPRRVFERRLFVHDWCLVLLCSPLPAAAAVRFRDRRRRVGRARAGRCPACGYDLRATPGRCPECGTGDGQRVGLAATR